MVPLKKQEAFPNLAPAGLSSLLSWPSLEAFSAPLPPNALATMSLCASFPWFGRPFWTSYTLNTYLYSPGPLCLLLSGRWGITSPEGPARFSSCLSGHPAPLQHGAGLSPAGCTGCLLGCMRLCAPHGREQALHLSGVRQDKCSIRVCQINERSWSNRSHLPEYWIKAGQDSVAFPRVDEVG